MNEDTYPLCQPSSIQQMESLDMEPSPPYTQKPITMAPEAAPSPPPIVYKGFQGSLLLGPDKTVTTCPHCQTSVLTTIKHTTTTRTHLLALLCSFCCCCSCIPYCCNSARNTDHYCPSCSKYLGTYDK